jgi:hypothetical protein
VRVGLTGAGAVVAVEPPGDLAGDGGAGHGFRRYDGGGGFPAGGDASGVDCGGGAGCCCGAGGRG